MLSHDLYKLVWGCIYIGVFVCNGCGKDKLLMMQEFQANPEISIQGASSLNFAKGQASFDLTNSNPDNNYIIILLSSLFEIENTIGYSITGDQIPLISSLPAVQKTINEAADINANSDFHQILRQWEENLSDEEPYHPDPAHVSLATTKLALGDSHLFKVLSNIEGSTSPVTGILRYMNDDFLLYVDERNVSSLSDNAIEILASDYSFSIQVTRDLFGVESDVDENGYITILLTQGVNELGKQIGGLITGYFNAMDLYPDSVSSTSNEMEIIYGVVPDPTGAFGIVLSESFALTNILPPILPHEFQHIVNYNQHVLVGGGFPEKDYLNEGLSYLAGDIYNINNDDYMMVAGIENPSLAGVYLDDTSAICFTCGTSLRQRGGIYLFLRYLYEQAEWGNLSGAVNGADFILRLLNSRQTGMTNLVYAAIGSHDTSYFSNLLGTFGLALYFSNTEIINDTHYGFQGINLQVPQNDNRGTLLSGPTVNIATFPFSGTLASSGLSYISFTGLDALNAGGVIKINMGNGFVGGGYLITVR